MLLVFQVSETLAKCTVGFGLGSREWKWMGWMLEPAVMDGGMLDWEDWPERTLR